MLQDTLFSATLLKRPSVSDNFGKWFLCARRTCWAVHRARRKALGKSSGTGPLAISFLGDLQGTGLVVMLAPGLSR